MGITSFTLFGVVGSSDNPQRITVVKH